MKSLCRASLMIEVMRDQDSEAQIALAIEAVGLLRGLRSQMGIRQREPLAIKLQVSNSDELSHLTAAAQLLVDLASAEDVALEVRTDEQPRGWAVATGEGLTLLANLAGKVDVEAETARLTAEISKNDKELGKCHGKLSNARFVERAPEAVVAEERRRLSEFERRSCELKSALERLADLEL